MDRKKFMKELKNFKENLSKKIPVEKIVVFGSYAKGNIGKDSDADLLIISSTFEKVPFIERTKGLYKLWHIDVPYDFICMTPKEVEERKNGANVISIAMKEGIAV